MTKFYRNANFVIEYANSRVNGYEIRIMSYLSLYLTLIMVVALNFISITRSMYTVIVHKCNDIAV